MKAALIRAGLRIHVWGLPLYEPGVAPVPVPPLYYTVGELDEGQLSKLVELYRSIFGLEFGEGGRCQQCRRVIPLAEFNQMKFYQRRCDCGGMFLSYYPPDELRLRIRRELKPLDGNQPVLALMGGRVLEQGRRPLGLRGCAWGTVVRVSALERRLANGRFSERTYWPEISRLIRKLRFLGFEDPTNPFAKPVRLMFVDEYLISRFERTVEAEVFLARLLFEHALDHGAKGVLVWTKPDWPFNRFWESLGFGEIYRIEDYHFLLNPDVRPALRLFQNAKAGMHRWQRLISFLL